MSNYIHPKCGGRIDIGRRACTKCKKTWGILNFYLFTSDIRKVIDTRDSKLARIRPLTVQSVANKLPKWPRWARIATVVVIVLLALEIWLQVK